MEINQKWIDQQRAICDAAHSGKWEWEQIGEDTVLASHCEWTTFATLYSIAVLGADANEADQVFLAQARASMLAALDALEAAMHREAEKDATIARLTAERDAAVKDITHRAWNCKNSNGCTYKSAVTGMLDCDGCNDWEWIGPCAENAQEGGGGNG